MRTASINELKEELNGLSMSRLTGLCLRLARFKKENKELLTYLLFEAHDEQGYLSGVKKEIDGMFEGINQTNVYFAKKTIRKILRITNKYIRYTGSKLVEVELLIYFCKSLNNSGIPLRKSAALVKLYDNQVKKIGLSVKTLHEDLQYDYVKELNQLT